MATKKRRSFQHIMEEKSYSIFESAIPEEWVIHEYRPDYGIDCVVEIFQYVDNNKEVAETLGESFYVQLKSIKKTDIVKYKSYKRDNVEVVPLEEDRSEYYEIEAIKFSIDVSELMTIQAMGASIPVLLVLVSLDTSKVFYICLNDYIDKLIIPNNPDYANSKFKQIIIPIHNELLENHDHLVPLRFYAKRPKLYAAFSKFIYQSRELSYRRDTEIVKHFIKNILRYDFWDTIDMWCVIKDIHNEIVRIGKMLNDTNFIDETLFHQVLPLWDKLSVLNSDFEELCREWFLPSYAGIEGSFRRGTYNLIHT